MAYVVGPACVADYSCLEVCPADCIRPRPDDPEFITTEQLYIDPRSCVNCEACVPACPVDAIHHELRLPPEHAEYASINVAWFEESR